MKRIAIPTDRSTVEQHFGRCTHYTIVTLDQEGQLAETELLRSEGKCGCKSDVMHVLSQKGVTVLLAGHMGDGAAEKFRRVGIDLIRGCKGPVDSLIADYRNGLLRDSGASCKTHKHG